MQVQQPPFEVWWNLYPRKVGKIAARRAWIRQRLDLVADEVIGHLAEQVERQYKNTPKKYIPHPTTYLNQGRWEDEIEEVDAVEEPLPRNNEDLPAWAASKGYREPRVGETWYEYRAYVERTHRGFE